jgi:hypothetical protein
MNNILRDYFVDKDNTPSRRIQGKRMLADYESCKLELRTEIKQLFKVFDEALNKTNTILALMPPQIRSRTLEPSVIQSCFAESLLAQFEDKAFFGKYKRLILRVKGYLILFKKLDKKGYPMNIKTLNVQSILNQSKTLDLFSESDYNDDPILYFGYKKNKMGEFIDPQLIYIDEAKLKFNITADDINVMMPVSKHNSSTKGRTTKEVKPTLKGLSTKQK